MIRTLVALCTTLVLAGCVSAPAPLRGEFAPIDPGMGAREDHHGARVRWGGTIAEVEPGPSYTCFQVVGRRLSDDARPRPGDHSAGRFLACREGFYDPGVFAEGREITVVGRIDGSEDRPIGEFVYRHPRVDAERIYLWPDRSRATVVYPVGYRPWYW